MSKMSDEHLCKFYRFWRDHYRDLDFDEAMKIYSNLNLELPVVEIKINVDTSPDMDGFFLLRTANVKESSQISTLFDDITVREAPAGCLTRIIMDNIIENLLKLQDEDQPNPKISALITRMQQEYEAIFIGGSK